MCVSFHSKYYDSCVGTQKCICQKQIKNLKKNRSGVEIIEELVKDVENQSLLIQSYGFES